MSAAGAALVELVLAADRSAWADAGFLVAAPSVVRVGSVRLELAGAAAGKRIVRCALSGVDSDDFDGLPIARVATRSADGAVPAADAGAPHADGPVPTHPNGVTRIDHVIAFTPDLDRTVAAGQA